MKTKRIEEKEINCHVIPRFLIKSFFGKGRVWNLKINEEIIARKKIACSACHANFYIDNGDWTLEEKLAEYESGAAKIIEKINKSEKTVSLTKKELERLMKFLIIQRIRTKEANIITSNKLTMIDIENLEKNFYKIDIVENYFISIFNIENIPFISTNIFGLNLWMERDTLPGNIFFPIGKKIIVLSPFCNSKLFIYEMMKKHKNDDGKVLKEYFNSCSFFSKSLNSLKKVHEFNGPLKIEKKYRYLINDKCLKNNEENNINNLIYQDLLEWNIIDFDPEILEIILITALLDKNIDFVLINDLEKFKIFLEKNILKMKCEIINRKEWKYEKINEKKQYLELLFSSMSDVEKYHRLIQFWKMVWDNLIL
ncbi:MAG: DUF4238 domain-containing protein [Mycoplasmoidaceae bacterium]